MPDPEVATYRCTTCGCETLPPIFRQTIAELEALGDRERHAAMRLVLGYSLYGNPEGRGWSGMVYDCLRVFLPSFFEAQEIGPIENILHAAHEPDAAEERPAAWTAETARDLGR